LKICPICNNNFESIYKDKIYCSSKCKRKKQKSNPLHNINSKKRRRLNLLSKLSTKYGCICWYCGRELTDLVHIDHIIPKCDGGSNLIDNRALSCDMCNMAKNRHSLTEFKDWLSYIRNSTFKPLI